MPESTPPSGNGGTGGRPNSGKNRWQWLYNLHRAKQALAKSRSGTNYYYDTVVDERVLINVVNYPEPEETIKNNAAHLSYSPLQVWKYNKHRFDLFKKKYPEALEKLQQWMNEVGDDDDRRAQSLFYGEDTSESLETHTHTPASRDDEFAVLEPEGVDEDVDERTEEATLVSEEDEPPSTRSSASRHVSIGPTLGSWPSPSQDQDQIVDDAVRSILQETIDRVARMQEIRNRFVRLKRMMRPNKGRGRGQGRG